MQNIPHPHSLVLGSDLSRPAVAQIAHDAIDAAPSLRSSRQFVDLPDGIDYSVRLVKLDVLRAVAGEYLFSIRRQSKQASLCSRNLLLIFQTFRCIGRPRPEVANAV